jgi:hypothetical protein
MFYTYVNEVIDPEYNIMPKKVAPVLAPINACRSYAANIANARVPGSYRAIHHTKK